MSRSSTILLTGALGEIWTNTGPLMPDPQRFRETDALAGRGLNGPVEVADVLNPDALLPLMAGVDKVVHLAIASARHLGHLTARERDDEAMRVNVLGTQHVFEAARMAGVEKVVFFSSLCTMLGFPRHGFVDADTPPRPCNLYACTKLFGEHLAEFYSRRHGMSFTCVRLGQPCPLPKLTPEAVAKYGEPNFAAELVAWPDLAAGLTAALASTAPYATFNLVSGSLPGRYELESGARLGYRPAWRFDGLVPQRIRG